MKYKVAYLFHMKLIQIGAALSVRRSAQIRGRPPPIHQPLTDWHPPVLLRLWADEKAIETELIWMHYLANNLVYWTIDEC